MPEANLITGIILASGLSRRMAGVDKLLLPVGGLPMVEHVMRAAQGSKLDKIILAYQNPAVAELAKKYRIQTVYNPAAAHGQSESLKTGVQAAPVETAAYMFLTGDQPKLTSATIDLLVQTWRDHSDRIIVPVYTSSRGSPVVFPASFRDRLLALEGDTGGKVIMERCPEMLYPVKMPDPTSGIDVDTPEEYSSTT